MRDLTDLPLITVTDEPEGTWYHLHRYGAPSVSAAWPHPLLELCPEAIQLGANKPLPGGVYFDAAGALCGNPPFGG